MIEVKVKTIKPEVESTDWGSGTDHDIRERKWGEVGFITSMSNSHGLCYEVTFSNGEYSWYEPRELQLVK